MRLAAFIPLLLLAAPAGAQLPSVLHTEVNPGNGHTYHLLDVSNRSDAETAAIALGGHLVTVDDQAESDWVQQTFASWGGLTRHLWIGLTDEVVEGTFEWADGTPVGYTRWHAGEPNNSLSNDPINGEDYVICYPGGTWVDLHDTSSSIWFPNLCGVVEIAGPSLALTGTCPGVATLAAAGATAGGPVAFAYAFSSTPSVLPGGGCAGTTIPVTGPILLVTVLADANGDALLSGNMPNGACGTVTVLGFDVLSCTPTNAIDL